MSDLKIKELEALVIKYITEILKLDDYELTLDSSIDNVQNWDSIAHIDILLKFEETFGKQFDIEDIAKIKSVKDWIALLLKHT